jgi:thioredoxin reductase (NADPH)
MGNQPLPSEIAETPSNHAKVIILGAGPAGYTAAIYAARAMMQPMLISSDPGGQLMITTEVENYPGFADPIQGPWLMEQMQLQAERVGTKLVYDHVIKADLSKAPFTLTGDGGTTYTCDALIVATGAKARWLGIPSEETYKGYGVSACATCDGFFYRNKDVVVVGGGNSAVEEALYLANIASKVTIVHRRDAFRAERIMQDRLFAHPKIEVIWNHAVDEICGGGTPPAVTHARLKDVNSGALRDVPAQGVFVAIGHSPASELFAGQIDMKQNSYIKTVPGSTKTNIPGVFAAGDVADDQYRQAVTAAGLGCMAALEAEHWLAARAL